MSRARVHCRGCNRVFTPRGLSQHLSRSHSPNCRAVYATIQLPITFQTRAATSRLVSNPVPTSWVHNGVIRNGTGLEHGTTPVIDEGDIEAMPVRDVVLTVCFRGF